MTWKELLSEPNTRVTVVKEDSILTDELNKAMSEIIILAEFDHPDLIAAVKAEAFVKKEEGLCESWEKVFPIKWYSYEYGVKLALSGIRLFSKGDVAVRVTIVFHEQTERILLVCESELK